MGNVLEFAARTANIDSQHEPAISTNEIQKSLAQSAWSLLSSLAILGESLQRSDSIICQIQDAQTRESLRHKSEQIYDAWVFTSIKLLNAFGGLPERIGNRE